MNFNALFMNHQEEEGKWRGRYGARYSLHESFSEQLTFIDDLYSVGFFLYFIYFFINMEAPTYSITLNDSAAEKRSNLKELVTTLFANRTLLIRRKKTGFFI